MNCSAHYTCATLTSSNCISWQGAKLVSVSEDKLDCDVRLTDVVRELDNALKVVQDSISLNGFPDGCLTVKPDLDTIRTILERIQTMICRPGSSGGLTPDAVLGADLGCLTDGCTTQDTRTLKQILELLAREICQLKTASVPVTSPTSQQTLFLP